jgi:hypothetical protein
MWEVYLNDVLVETMKTPGSQSFDYETAMYDFQAKTVHCYT